MHLLPVRVNYLNHTHANVKILCQLVIHITPAVIGRHDFDDQLWRDVEVTLRFHLSQTFVGDKGIVFNAIDYTSRLLS